MARVTHVKRAQQRYATKPVIDPATGEQKRTPVMKNGTQVVTKRGPQFMRVTERDLDQPLDMPRCDAPQCKVAAERDGDKTIRVGDAYKHISPKSGPYGGRTLTRHEACPTWHVWEYSSSLSARLAEISHNFWEEIDSANSPDDVQSALDSASGEIESLAEEKRESASNIEDGFGHATQASEELEEIADSLESWASEVSSADIPDLPEPEDEDCEECGGTGSVETEALQNGESSEEKDCEACNGTGTIEAGDEPTEEQLDDWRDEVRDALSVIDEPPV